LNYGDITAHGGDKKISIIICSIDQKRCEKTLLDISRNIGVEYETIVFDNTESNWGICKVYNHCAEKATSPCLCFMHEDVLIETKTWGKIIVDFMEKKHDCGVIGFAGGLQANRNFWGWGAGENRINVNDGLTGRNDTYWKLNYKKHLYANPENELYSQVLCIDGLCHFVKKSVWGEIKYDEKNFSGFHFYDNDFSFAVAQKYKNYVLLNIDIFHDSSGSMDKEYIENIFVFQNKWDKKLPLYLENSVTKKSRLKMMHSELREMVEIYKLCKKKNVKIKKYIEQMCKINGTYIIPIFYIYYLIKKICVKIISILEKI
jgi:hypothetical protein